MRTILAVLIIAFYILGSRAQEQNWSAELNYPVSIGDSFGASNQGVVGLGLAYRFAEFDKVKLGASLDAVWFATTFTNDTDPVQELDFRDFFLQPRLFAELPLGAGENLKLRGGLGWTWYRSTGEVFFNSEGRIEGVDHNSGPGLNLGLSYDFFSRWYLQAQYDLIFSSGDLPSSTLGLLKIGVGFRF